MQVPPPARCIVGQSTPLSRRQPRPGPPRRVGRHQSSTTTAGRRSTHCRHPRRQPPRSRAPRRQLRWARWWRRREAGRLRAQPGRLGVQWVVWACSAPCVVTTPPVSTTECARARDARDSSRSAQLFHSFLSVLQVHRLTRRLYRPYCFRFDIN